MSSSVNKIEATYMLINLINYHQVRFNERRCVSSVQEEGELGSDFLTIGIGLVVPMKMETGSPKE
ncbi:15964_t:CDS:2 [Entrophospora sp. SA101]|nr:15964_t:CDS:2 [Entrophospora sp. SA101]CAJ0925738.1 4032_t:CDS:2 [Entrophospora sp. SA101]